MKKTTLSIIAVLIYSMSFLQVFAQQNSNLKNDARAAFNYIVSKGVKGVDGNYSFILPDASIEAIKNKEGDALKVHQFVYSDTSAWIYFYFFVNEEVDFKYNQVGDNFVSSVPADKLRNTSDKTAAFLKKFNKEKPLSLEPLFQGKDSISVRFCRLIEKIKKGDENSNGMICCQFNNAEICINSENYEKWLRDVMTGDVHSGDINLFFFPKKDYQKSFYLTFDSTRPWSCGEINGKNKVTSQIMKKVLLAANE